MSWGGQIKGIPSFQKYDSYTIAHWWNIVDFNRDFFLRSVSHSFNQQLLQKKRVQLSSLQVFATRLQFSNFSSFAMFLVAISHECVHKTVQSLSRYILYICANCKVIIFNFLVLYILRMFLFVYVVECRFIVCKRSYILAHFSLWNI